MVGNGRGLFGKKVLSSAGQQRGLQLSRHNDASISVMRARPDFWSASGCNGRLGAASYRMMTSLLKSHRKQMRAACKAGLADTRIMISGLVSASDAVDGSLCVPKTSSALIN